MLFNGEMYDLSVYEMKMTIADWSYGGLHSV